MILAADIGGTNCRLASFEAVDGNLQMQAQVWLSTASIRNTEALLAAFLHELHAQPRAMDAVVVAVAGPVCGHVSGSLTNGELELDFAPLNSGNAGHFFLINDFVAQAYAVFAPLVRKHIAGPDSVGIRGPRAVIGAGTGLGHALLLPMPDGQWQALPSENGHAAFPFIGDMENSWHNFLRTQLGIAYGTGDDVLTGRGLACLHHFLTGEKLDAAAVGRTALQTETETLAIYSRLYARACRNWMLATLPTGGLWIAGGIAAQNPLAVTSHYFMAELYNHPRFEALLRNMPVYLLEDTASGLWGAAEFGRLACKQS